MNNNMTEEEKQIIVLYKEGLSARKVAERINVNMDRVRYVCKKFNVRRSSVKVTCKYCGDEFKTSNNRRKFCSDSCRGRHNKRNRGIKQVCEWCNNKFTRYNEQRFCNNECLNSSREQSRRKRELLTRLVRAMNTDRHKNCKHCGVYFYGKRVDSTYCSDRCYYLDTRVLVYYNHTCRECGKEYRDNIANSAGCSEQCKRRYANRRDSYNRDTRLRNNGPIDWDISVATIVARDGTLCYICGEHTDDKDYIINDEGHFIAGNNFPSIDHVIPISKGGTHQWGNVKLAHRICNSIKSDNEIDKEALLL